MDPDSLPLSPASPAGSRARLPLLVAVTAPFVLVTVVIMFIIGASHDRTVSQVVTAESDRLLHSSLKQVAVGLGRLMAKPVEGAPPAVDVRPNLPTPAVLVPLLATASAYAGQINLIADASGRVIADSRLGTEGAAPNVAAVPAEVLVREALAEIRAQDPTLSPTVSFTSQGQVYFARSQPWSGAAGQHWQLVSVLPESALIGNARNENHATLLWAALCIAIGAGVSVLVIRRVTSPIVETALAARAIALGTNATHSSLPVAAKRLPNNFATRRVSEIAMLIDAFVHMQKRIESYVAELRQRVVSDMNTGLMTRAGLEEALRWPEQKPVNLMLFGIDDFRAVNESLGMQAGDRLLKAIAGRLRDETPPGGWTVRFSGYEFLIVWCDGEGVPDFEQCVSKLRSVFEEQFDTGTDMISVTASLGVVRAVANGMDVVTRLVRQASLAVRKARTAGKGGRADYDEHMADNALESARLLAELKVALKNDELIAYYQPIFSLRTGKLDGLEALVRWKSPSRGMVNPGVFISIAEESGLIIELGTWVLRRATRDVAELIAKHSLGPDFTVHVNMSVRQLVQSDVVAVSLAALRDANMPSSALVLEVTESLLIDPKSPTLTNLTALQSHGIRIAIDDFGTGYSSLSYLHRLTFQKLKIDRSFIVEASDSPRSALVLRTVLQMADDLGIECVAEGVETLEQADLLRRLGCGLVQGFLYGRPGPINEVWDKLAALPNLSVVIPNLAPTLEA